MIKQLAMKDTISYLSISISCYLKENGYMDDIDMWDLVAVIVDYSKKVEKDIEENDDLLSLNIINKHYSFCLTEVFNKFNLNMSKD